MFVVFLKFSANKDRAGAFMDAHNSWLRRGFDAGVFVLAGSLQPRLGGGILAHSVSREALEARVAEDPFVAEGIVSAEIVELAPAKADPRLDFLVA
ncbi:YciI family protein [Pelagibacterium xiamenense]|uniref:YciI family protein n=1 Tax=Pelagibacterium xiamenense TaxID=2901140 RepID=UPI001E3A9EA3|nr:YciI family protein [Pelagibacterium xiamenense]MCD7061454.1 YciI family protein [Pelagibacterium xiamenense]